MDINLFETHYLMAIAEEIVPAATFFRDRYFPTGAGDVFAADKVLTEYRDGDRKLAAFVSERAGDIPIARRGYEMHEYEPAYIAPSRVLTLDELKKRGFGEALYSDSTEAERAAKLLLEDMQDITKRIERREEWMAAQTMITNGCIMQTYIDDRTEGEKDTLKFYDGDASDHIMTVSTPWNNGGDFFGNVRAMCRQLTKRGLAATDLILGCDAADEVLKREDVKEALNRTSGIIVGTIEQELTKYDGVVFMGVLNFGGHRLNLFSVDENYVDEAGAEQSYFPSKAAMVTAPACGHMMYGAVTQINFGSSDYTTHKGIRIPKLSVNQENDTRKLRVASRPLAIPHNRAPYVFADNVVQ